MFPFYREHTHTVLLPQILTRAPHVNLLMKILPQNSISSTCFDWSAIEQLETKPFWLHFGIESWYWCHTGFISCLSTGWFRMWCGHTYITNFIKNKVSVFSLPESVSRGAMVSTTFSNNFIFIFVPSLQICIGFVKISKQLFDNSQFMAIVIFHTVAHKHVC